MNNGISLISYSMNRTNFGSKPQNAKKAMSSIDIAYDKELKEIQRRKQDRDAIHKLNPKTPIQNLRDKIQITLDSILSIKK